MKKIVLEVIKTKEIPSPEFLERTKTSLDLTALDGVLSPEEIFMMEYALNSGIPHLRFHISVRDE